MCGLSSSTLSLLSAQFDVHIDGRCHNTVTRFQAIFHQVDEARCSRGIFYTGAGRSHPRCEQVARDTDHCIFGISGKHAGLSRKLAVSDTCAYRASDLRQMLTVFPNDCLLKSSRFIAESTVFAAASPADMADPYPDGKPRFIHMPAASPAINHRPPVQAAYSFPPRVQRVRHIPPACHRRSAAQLPRMLFEIFSAFAGPIFRVFQMKTADQPEGKGCFDAYTGSHRPSRPSVGAPANRQAAPSFACNWKRSSMTDFGNSISSHHTDGNICDASNTLGHAQLSASREFTPSADHDFGFQISPSASAHGFAITLNNVITRIPVIGCARLFGLLSISGRQKFRKTE